MDDHLHVIRKLRMEVPQQSRMLSPRSGHVIIVTAACTGDKGSDGGSHLALSLASAATTG
jgi:hypothetical protein